MANPLSLHVVVDLSRVGECAAALHQQLQPDQWATLTALAAEILSRQEAAATGSLVVLIPASAQVAQVVRDLGVPGLDRAAEKLRLR